MNDSFRDPRWASTAVGDKSNDISLRHCFAEIESMIVPMWVAELFCADILV